MANLVIGSVGKAHEPADRDRRTDSGQDFGLQPLDRRVGGVGGHLDGAAGGVGRGHLALHSVNLFVEGRHIQPHASACQFGFQPDLERILFLLVERTRRRGRRGIAQVVATTAKPFRIVAVQLRTRAQPALQADLGRHVSPGVTVPEVEFALVRDNHAGTVAGGGNLHVLFLQRIAGTHRQDPIVTEVDVVVHEDAARQVILIASKRRALVSAQHAALPVSDVLSEEIDPEGRLPPVAEPPRVAQLVAELRLVGEREQVKDRVHGRVDIHQGFVPDRAPAEHVGDRTPAKPHAPVGFDDEVLPVHERKSRLVDGEIETAETPPVLCCRSVAVGVALFIDHRDVKPFRRPPGHHGPEHSCLFGADRTATGRTVLEPAPIVTVADGKPRADLTVGQSAFDTRAEAAVQPGLHTHGGVCGKFAARTPRSKQHGPARHIAAEQKALRATQDLSRFQVQHIHDHAVVDAQVHAVDEHTDGGVDGRDGARNTKAANGKVGDALAGTDGVEGDVGQCVAQILDVGHVPRGQSLACEDTDGGGNELNDLRFALLGGSGYHLFQHARIRRRHLRPARRESQQQCKQGSIHDNLYPDSQAKS